MTLKNLFNADNTIGIDVCFRNYCYPRTKQHVADHIKISLFFYRDTTLANASPAAWMQTKLSAPEPSAECFIVNITVYGIQRKPIEPVATAGKALDGIFYF